MDVAAKDKGSGRPKVVVVMPAFNAAKTLRITYNAIPTDKVDQIILVDDGSKDETLKIAKELNLMAFVHTHNFGYGANQTTCYMTEPVPIFHGQVPENRVTGQP